MWIIFSYGVLYVNIPPFVRLFFTVSKIFSKKHIFGINFLHTTYVLIVLAWTSYVLMDIMGIFYKDYSIRKTFIPLSLCNHAIGCQNKSFSVGIPSGVHIPSGVPTPVRLFVYFYCFIFFTNRMTYFWIFDLLFCARILVISWVILSTQYIFLHVFCNLFHRLFSFCLDGLLYPCH